MLCQEPSKAGGPGRFAAPDPTAVPGSGGQGMETPAGTRLYIAKLKALLHRRGLGRFWARATASTSGVGGQGFDEAPREKCMSEVTAPTTAILNPAAGLPL